MHLPKVTMHLLKVTMHLLDSHGLLKLSLAVEHDRVIHLVYLKIRTLMELLSGSHAGDYLHVPLHNVVELRI